MDSINELHAALKEKNTVIGTKRTLKLLREGKVKKIFLAANTAEPLKKDINYYSGLTKTQVVQLSTNNEELGALCKKPYSISVIGVYED